MTSPQLRVLAPSFSESRNTSRPSPTASEMLSASSTRLEALSASISRLLWPHRQTNCQTPLGISRPPYAALLGPGEPPRKWLARAAAAVLLIAGLATLAMAAGCGEFPTQGGQGGVMAMGDQVSTKESPLIIQCGPTWSAQIGINDNVGNGDGICFNDFHDGSTSGFVPSGWHISGIVSNAVPLHIWLCDHERAGGGVPQPWPFYSPGFVSQTTGHCYRTEGVNGTFYRSIGAAVIKSVLIASSWTQQAPACPAPTVNDTYTDCGSLSDSGLPNVLAKRFGAPISGTWPDGSSGAPCTGQRILPPGDQFRRSTFVGSVCPVN